MGSHRSILKATAWTGSSQIAMLAMGLVRSKLTAVLLGPGGVGLTGTYLTITGFIGGIAQLGIPQSGVRAVAEACATGDEEGIRRMEAALQAAMLATGVVGMVVGMVVAYPVSVMTFGSGERWVDLALLSVTVLLANYAAGLWASLQGKQRVRDVARCQVLSTFAGLLVGAGLLWAFGERGIVAALVANGMATLVAFGLETRRGGGRLATWTSLMGALRDAKGLLGLGAAFLFQNLVLGVGGYWSRVLIMGHGGLAALGLYTAAWTLSGYAVQMILAAMGSDFYPRLTAVAGDACFVRDADAGTAGAWIGFFAGFFRGGAAGSADVVRGIVPGGGVADWLYHAGAEPEGVVHGVGGVRGGMRSGAAGGVFGVVGVGGGRGGGSGVGVFVRGVCVGMRAGGDIVSVQPEEPDDCVCSLGGAGGGVWFDEGGFRGAGDGGWGVADSCLGGWVSLRAKPDV